MNVLDHVRMATLDDLGALINFAKEFHKSSPYSHVKFNYGKTLNGLKNIIEGPKTSSVVLVAHENHRPVGMVVAVVEAPPFSDEQIAMELCWFISKPYRKSRKGLVLFKAYEEWARRVGAKIIQTAYLLGDGQSDPDGFYVKQGFSPVEKSYIKRVR